MIIECKCKKYKFKIPKDEILVSGSNVKCGICNDEWSINLDISKSKSKNLDILENINPSKANINFKIKDNKKEIKPLFYTLIFLAIFFIFYKFLIYFKVNILQKFPDLKNFYESLELVTEIIKFYIGFFKELFSE